MLREKIDYLSRSAQMVVFAGSLPRGVDEGFYAEMIRELHRKGVPTAIDAEGEPLRLAIDAEPELASPNQLEAEALVGQEFSDVEDFALAIDTISEMGARNVLLTYEHGCFALLRNERSPAARYHAKVTPVEAVSPVGAGSVVLAGYVAAQLEKAGPEEALRRALAAGTASTLEVGAGQFEPREAGRLIGEVEVSGLEAVHAEH